MKYDFETISDRNEMGSRKWAVRSEQFPNMKKDVVIESIKEVSLEELDQIIGAGNGVFKTISHECHLNTWAFLATCCS